MTTLTQTAAILLIVSAVAIPHQGFAAKNDNRFQQSAEAKHAKMCTELKDSYDFNMNYYKEKPKQRGKWKDTAGDLKLIAEGNNCSWAM
jgi:hypothetical protein